MESDVAKPFRMLSAYLMTAAMTRPPSAWRNNKHTEADGERHDLKGPTESFAPKRDGPVGKGQFRSICVGGGVTCRATTVQVIEL